MVLEKLGDSLKQAFRKISSLSSIDREAVESVIRDLQRSLLQADVDAELVIELSDSIKKKVLSGKTPPGMTLKEHFIKVLYDEIVGFLGKGEGGLEIKPQRILLVGLFGSGKTTTAGKLAKWFRSRGLKPALVACDTFRPAAKEQISQTASSLGIPAYTEGKSPKDVAAFALRNSKEDVLIFDSAGRNALDEELARELKELAKAAKPDEVLLVIPADIGQAARRQSEEFGKLVGITGVIVTKMDGTAKGGGALAAASVSGATVKFITTGEKLSDIEAYDPKRFVGRLIGYGDLQGLLEKAREAGIGADAKSAERLMSGKFDMNDFYEQIGQMQKMGSMSKIIEMIPGLGGMKLPKGTLDVQEEKMRRWRYAIDSMTPEERKEPDLIKASRISRIAKGSGVPESEVRELLKYFRQTQKLMKMAKGGKGFRRGPFAQIAKQFGLGGM